MHICMFMFIYMQVTQYVLVDEFLKLFNQSLKLFSSSSYLYTTLSKID